MPQAFADTPPARPVRSGPRALVTPTAPRASAFAEPAKRQGRAASAATLTTLRPDARGGSLATHVRPDRRASCASGRPRSTTRRATRAVVAPEEGAHRPSARSSSFACLAGVEGVADAKASEDRERWVPRVRL